jgi:tetratricopeptide (TPR) repeat protein
LGALAYLRGDWAQAVRYYRDGQVVQERIGDVTSAALGAANIAEVRSDQGHWAEAVAILDEALEVWRSTGHRHGVAYALGLRGRALARGAVAEAVDVLTEAERVHREVGAAADASQVAVWGAEARVLRDQADLALQALDAGADDGSLTAQRVRASALVLEGRAHDGTVMLVRAVEQAAADKEWFELICLVRAADGLDVPVTDPIRSHAERARDQLGVVRVAVLPGQPL